MSPDQTTSSDGRLTDEQLHEIADADPWATYTASIPRQLAAELLELRARVTELETERDETRAEAVQAVADLEPIDAVRGQLDIAHRNLEGERRRAENACQARNDLASRYARTLATLRKVLTSRRGWQDRAIALTDALDCCGCYEGEILMPIPMTTVYLPGDAPAEVAANA